MNDADLKRRIERAKELLGTARHELRARLGKDQLDISYYAGESPQRMWAARITHFWVNSVERDAEGHVVKDGRQEITAIDLL